MRVHCPAPEPPFCSGSAFAGSANPSLERKVRLEPGEMHGRGMRETHEFLPSIRLGLCLDLEAV